MWSVDGRRAGRGREVREAPCHRSDRSERTSSLLYIRCGFCDAKSEMACSFFCVVKAASSYSSNGLSCCFDVGCGALRGVAGRCGTSALRQALQGRRRAQWVGMQVVSIK